LATIDRYKKGLLDLELSESQLAMLEAHYRAPDRRITMTKLAKTMGYKNYGGANLQYGKLAKKLCETMATVPDERYKDGSPFWLSIIAECWKNNDGEYEFQMWPELAEALKELSLV